MPPMTGSERSLVAMTAIRFMLFCQPSESQTISWHSMLPLLPFVHVHAEGFLSLSTSHTTAFLRAINHGCKDDPCWDLIQNGWPWLILSHLVEGQWPMLPTLLQGAMNSANSISKAPSELELAAQLAHLFILNVPLHEAKQRKSKLPILASLKF